jgi:hypothetical protein
MLRRIVGRNQQQPISRGPIGRHAPPRRPAAPLVWGIVLFAVALLAIGPGVVRPALADSQTVSNPASIGGSPALYPSPITIAGMSGTVTNVTITLTNIVGDGFALCLNNLDVLLVSPTGQKLLLMSDVGDVSSGCGSNGPQTYTFDDAGATMPAPEARPANGTYKPANFAEANTGLCPNGNLDTFPSPAPAGPYASTLATFTGVDPNGVWNLYVVNDCISSVRISGGWSLTVTTPTQPPTLTPTSTSTQTPTQTPTSTSTQTPTSTPTQTPTRTPTPTQTPTSTPTPTNTATPTRTVGFPYKVLLTQTAEALRSSTPTPTLTATLIPLPPWKLF